MKSSIVKLAMVCVIALGFAGCSIFNNILNPDNDNDLSTYQKMSDTDLANFVKTCDEVKSDSGHANQCKLAKQAKAERDATTTKKDDGECLSGTSFCK